MFTIFVLGGSRLSATDAIDRLTSARLDAIHQSVATLKTQRRVVARSGPLKEYRANLHVHSAFSHDSRGKIDEIIAAARAAGTSILMFTEHPAKHYDIFLDGHQGVQNGVLLIPGAETNGMLLYPRQSISEALAARPQDLSDIVRGREGLSFLSHLEERMDWDLRGLTGVEIYNTHADAKDEKRLFSSLKNPLWLLKSADLFRKYPQEAFSSLQDYPADYLRRWDQLCQNAPHTGVSANDSHQNIGLTLRMGEGDKVRVEDGLGEEVLKLDATAVQVFQAIPADAKAGDLLFQLRLDPYESSLRHVGTHLLMRELTQPAAWEALNQGRAFVAFDWIADATGFEYGAQRGETRQEMGAIVRLSDGLKLVAESPLSAHWKLMRDGAVEQELDGVSLSVAIKRPGNYRVELWLDVAGEQKVWILSNPIYVRE